MKQSVLTPLDVAGDVLELIPYLGIPWYTLLAITSEQMTPVDLQLKILLLKEEGVITVEPVPLADNPTITRTGGHPNVVSIMRAFR